MARPLHSKAHYRPPFEAPARATMQRFKQVLVAIDFNGASEHALELGTSIAEAFESSLTVLHVWQVPLHPYMDLELSAPELVRSVQRAAALRLGTTLHDLRRRLPRSQSLLRVGAPADQILAAARKVRADLLVLGTHGRRGLSHAILGSVAERIVRESAVPVLTARAID